MSVRITNAIVQDGDVTITSAQFVVAGGLSYNQKVVAFTTLMEHAAVSLDLPSQGPLAAEILYRIADERAGVPIAAPVETPVEAEPEPQGGGRVLPNRVATAFWVGLVLVIAAAFILQHLAV